MLALRGGNVPPIPGALCKKQRQREEHPGVRKWPPEEGLIEKDVVLGRRKDKKTQAA
jgi:hypothetical protein